MWQWFGTVPPPWLSDIYTIEQIGAGFQQPLLLMMAGRQDILEAAGAVCLDVPVGLVFDYGVPFHDPFTVDTSPE
jgi:hypothetical protein